MSQMDKDIENVRKGIRQTGYMLVGGSWPAFERIVDELKRLKAEQGDSATDAAMADYPTGDDP